jgi:hypothetical protein
MGYKEIEYTTKKGNVLTFSYKKCFSDSGAEGAWRNLYGHGMNITNSGTDYYEKIVEDEEIAKVLSIAREGDETLEDYIKSQKPKKWLVDISRSYRCTYTADFEVEAESEDEAIDKADDLVRKDFEAVRGLFNGIDLVDICDIAKLI